MSIFPRSTPIQRQSDGDSEGIADVPEAGGGGESIPDGVRAAMEQSFAQDFSDVRIHTGPEARQVGALAYTRGNDLHFQPGRYDPFGDTGRSLLGHELTHVVQQRAGRVASPTQSKADGTAPINADASLETEADTQGARAARGEPAHVSGAGAGVQRKAEGTPIQRMKLDEPQNLNQYVQGDVESQNAYRLRMGNAMTQQKQMLTANDALPMDVNATAPTIPNPKGFNDFQFQQRLERERELEALRNGRTNSLDPNGGTTTIEGADPITMMPRTAPVKSPLPDHFPVTQGSVGGTTDLMGDVTSPISTRTGGDLGVLEQKLNNPVSTVSHPREGILDRQQSIMETANNSDEHMRDLEYNNILPTHISKNNRTANGGWLFNGDQVGGGTLNNNTNEPYHAIGTNFFDQRRPINTGGVEKLLPQMPTWNNGLANTGNRSHESRTNVWSEADVNPVKVTGSGRSYRNGYGPNQPWANLENRDGERLLHTAPNSQVQTPNGQGGMSTGPVDHRFYVTNDHYKSAVPVSPLQEDYATNNPFQSPYSDPLSTNSLEGQDKKELPRMTGDNLEIAKQSSKRREALEEQRTQEDLKRLAPSDGVRSMYDMGKKQSEQWTLKNMERQHLDVQEFLKSGANSETNEPVTPMSNDVQSMYL